MEGAFQAEFVDNLVIFEMLKVFDVGPDDRIAGAEFEHRMYESYLRVSWAGSFSAGEGRSGAR
jgi:hypothetical protein